MNEIKILPDTLINQIAAGEVVQRPASVVKELIENALDADASAIEVHLAAGGKQMIKVVDNGHGMSRANMSMAIERHATSKISSFEDLSSITTMGFRGEAVPAIASVARLTISTSTRGASEGSELRMHGGVEPTISPCAPLGGTTFLVEDLFFNTPARRKFMKGDRAELNQCVDVLTRFALVHPHIKITVSHDGKKVFDLMPSELDERIALLCGLRRDELIEIAPLQRGPVSVYGYLSVPEKNYSNRSSLYIAVNGRFIKDPTPLQAVVQAAREQLPPGRFPAAFIYLECLPDWVDVNVHPAKTEVKFQDQSNLFGLVKSACTTAWKSYRQTDRAESPAPLSANKPMVPTTPSASTTPPHGSAAATSSSYAAPQPTGGAAREEREIFASATPQPLPLSASLDDIEIESAPLFQIDNIYIAVGYRGGLLLLDQHALHEKTTFLRLSAAAEKRILSQKLLMPEIISLTPKQLLNFERYREVLSSAGFEVELFGEREIACHAVPSILGRINPATILKAVFESTDPKGDLQEFKDAVIERISCHSSVRGGDRLSQSAMRDLFKQYLEIENASSCPHGRPVAKFISAAEMGKWFHR